MDLANLTEAELTQELDRRRRERVREFVARLPEMTYLELEYFLDVNECDHVKNYYYGDGARNFRPENCEVCAAHEEFVRRSDELEREKKQLPGALPAGYNSLISESAINLRVGDVLDHFPRPGLSLSEHVIVKDIEVKDNIVANIVIVVFQRTNDSEADEFRAVYEPHTRLASVWRAR